jgi:hypothetical protein
MKLSVSIESPLVAFMADYQQRHGLNHALPHLHR